MPQKPQNIKISSRAWELLRWAKFKLSTKSYGDAIVQMDERIAKSRSGRLKESLQEFDEEKHRIKVKIPEDENTPIHQPTKPKTILLNPEAHRILERVKIESNEPAYTFSDAIEFLVSENNLMPDHLRK
ncbi:MAG: hypothetical protein ACFFDT_22360 [Candidatus Hodarchaeota archaeon]